MAHSILAPSDAPRWSRCVGALAACKQLPPKASSIDSASGTLTHQIAERCLRTGTVPEHEALGRKFTVDGFEFTVDQDRCDRVRAYLSALSREPGNRYVEVGLDLSAALGVPGQYGTTDCVIVHNEGGLRHLSVHDLKDGAGIVYADSEQLLLYLIGAMREFASDHHEWGKLRTCVHQPRMAHYDERTWTFSEVCEKAAELRVAAQRAHQLYTAGTVQLSDLTPGPKQCKWCPLGGSCGARQQAIIDQFPVVGEPTVQQIAHQSDTDLAALYLKLDFIEETCSAVRKEAHGRALNGAKLPGLALRQGRKGARAWKDEETAATKLALIVEREKLYNAPTLKTPTQLEKDVGKEISEVLKPLVTQADGAWTLVPEEHRGRGPQREVAEFKNLSQELL